MYEYVLRTQNISKIYSNYPVLSNVTVEIKKGEICGFIGPNGAGKSTLIKIIAGVVAPSSGGIELFGRSDYSGLLQGRGKIGSIIESPAFYPNFNAYENMKSICLFLGIKADMNFIKEKLRDVGLSNVGTKKIKNYSLGMKQRLGIAMALLKDPEFMILDEPSNGLDPAGIMEIREAILRLNREKGITFLISSHILGELARVATKYIIIRKGKIVEQVLAEDLKNKGSAVLKISVDNLVKALQIVKELGGVDATVNNNTISSSLLANSAQLVTKKLIDAEINISSITSNSEDNESYLIKLMEGR